MSDGQSYSNSIRAGVFLITSFVVGLVILVILSKSEIFTSKSEYLVRFSMSEGVAGLDVGSEVRVSGLKVGRVNGIAQHFDQEVIDIRIQMNSEIPVFKDAQVIRTQPLLGNYSWLNFSSLGNSSAGRLEPGTTLEAKPSGGLLATIVGPQNASRANEMFTNVVALTASLDDFARVQYPKSIVPMLNDASVTVGKIKTDYDIWRTDITSSLTNAASSMKKLDSTLDDTQVAVKDARVMMGHFREVNLKQIDDILIAADKGTARFANSMENLDAELSARIPEIRSMLSDLRQSATQTKLATMEVRRSPWKLLYRPTGDELGRENLYESARAFAIASSDLRVAGETLRNTLQESPDRFKDDAKFRDAVKAEVTNSMSRYETAQKRLFDVLQADFKGEPLPSADAPQQEPIALPKKSLNTTATTTDAAAAK